MTLLIGIPAAALSQSGGPTPFIAAQIAIIVVTWLVLRRVNSNRLKALGFLIAIGFYLLMFGLCFGAMSR
jgi:hypothetical protein